MNGGLSRRLLLLLASTCGVTVGNVYFPQALAPVAAADRDLGAQGAAGVVTATQLGYAVGIFLLVPLADRVPHRRLVVGLLFLTALSLLVTGLGSDARVVLAAAACTGTSTVLAPIIAVMAVGLVSAGRRGVVAGTLLSGSIGGILLARTAGGVLAQQYGWRAPYLVAAALTLVLAVVLAVVLGRALPGGAAPVERSGGYLVLLGEPVRLLRTERALQRSALYQAAVFTGYSAVWTALGLLLTSDTYRFGSQSVGLVALTGAVTMLCTARAGGLVDRDGPDRVNRASALAAVAAAAVLALGGVGGVAGLAALVLGALVLDVAMQCGMVANQVRFLALPTRVRSRLTTAYMTCAYLGGSTGSWLGAQAYGQWGWPAPCALLAILAAATLTHLLLDRRAGARRGAGGVRARASEPAR